MRLTPPPCLAHKSTGRALAWTDFASAGFTEGSTPEGWTGVRSQLEARGKLFLPSVGPGYNDTLIRPWNAAQTKGRERGRYYDQMWGQALQTASGGVTITSYNEWGEGEQPALTLVPYCPGFGAQEQAGRSARQGRSREWQPDEATAPFRPCEPRAAREPTYMYDSRPNAPCLRRHADRTCKAASIQRWLTVRGLFTRCVRLLPKPHATLGSSGAPRLRSASG